MPPAGRAAFIHSLFDPTDGLGLNIYRIRIQAERSGEPHAEPFFDWTEHKRLAVGNFAKEIQTTYAPFIMASIWTPPGWMKSNGTESNGGYLLPEYYDEYARFLSLWVQGMKSEFGVTIDGLSFQNEPGWKSWESLQWTTAQIITFFKNNLIPTLIADGLIPAAGQPESGLKLIVNEETKWNDTEINALLADPAIAPHIDIAGAHVYGDSGFPVRRFTTAENAGKRVWQTEFYNKASPDPTSNTISYGLLIARYMQNMIVVNNVNAYNFWWMASPEDKNVQALVDLIDSNTSSSVMKQGYAFGQFSRFVRPGYIRVGIDNPFPARDPNNTLTTTELLTMQLCIAAFKSPLSDRTVLVAINDSTTPRTLQVTFGPSGASPQTLDLWRTSATENLAAAGSVNVTNGVTVLTLPANSVSTFTGAVVTESFASWCALHQLPVDETGLGAPEAQPAADGIDNLVKYSLGLNPFSTGFQGRFTCGFWTNSAATNLPKYFCIEARIPDPAPSDLTYRPFGGDTLESWPDPLIETSRTPLGDGSQTVIWRDPTPATNAIKRYLRFQVDKN